MNALEIKYSQNKKGCGPGSPTKSAKLMKKAIRLSQ